MKRFIATVLILCITLTLLVGCKKNKYKPAESTEEEARVVMTLTIGEQSYDVRYELYRAMFLTHKSEIDGGDDSVWSGEKKDEYIARINERIVSECARIYAVFELCRANGFNLYSKDIEDEIYEMIRVSVEGGVWGDAYYEGFGGDYDAYRDSLRRMYHNDSTAVLLMRYNIGRSLLEEHYVGDVSLDSTGGQITDGAIKYTMEQVRSFYFSDEAAQILQTYLPEEISYTPRERAESIRLDVIEAAERGDEAVKVLMINRGTPTAAAELESGLVVGAHSLARDYSALAEAALALDEGGVSEVIETVSATDGRRYYVVYRAEKSEEYFENNYATVVEVYLLDAIGGSLASIEGLLANGVSYADAYGEIIHGEVSI